MFGMLERGSSDPIEKLIEKVTDEMEMTDPDSDHFLVLMNHLDRLTKIKAQGAPARVSRDTVATVLGNLAGVLIIVAFEQKHVMSSKSFGTFIKPR